MSWNHYDLLGVSPEATTEEIRAGWKKAVKLFHSDVGGSDAQTAIFNHAYEVLTSPEKRQAYDEELAALRTDRRPPGQPAQQEDEEEAWGADDVWGEPPPPPPPSAPRSTPTGVRKMSWWRESFDDLELTITPPAGNARRFYLYSLLVWLLVLIPAIVTVAVLGGWQTSILLGLLLVLVVPPRWLAKVPFRRLLFVAAVISVIGVGLVAVDSLLAGLLPDRGVLGYSRPQQPWSWLVLTWSALVLIGALTVRQLAKRWDRAHALDQLVSPTVAVEFNLYGRPGERLFDMSAGRSAQGNFGSVGARRAAQLLEPLLQIPGAKILHGLPWPGQQGLVVPHALVCGDRIALIEPQNWSAGSYSFDSYGALLRNGLHFSGGEMPFAGAVDEWRKLIPDASIFGFVVVESTSFGRCDLPPSHANLAFTAPDSAVEDVGEFLAKGAGKVDRKIVAGLIVHPDSPQLRASF